MGDRKGVIGRITSLKQDVVDDFVDEFFSNPRFAEMIGGAIKRARSTRKVFDKNLQFFLHTLNLPSRADYSELLSRLEKMNDTVTDLEGRIDDLIATTERLTASSQKVKGKK